MKHKLLLLTSLAMLAASAVLILPAQAERETGDTIRIAVDMPYVPMEFQRANGSFDGFDIDLGNALCEIAELKCRWVPQTWEGIVAGLSARKYDMILSAMAMTPERKERFNMVGPYVRLTSAWFVRRDGSISVENAAELAGQRIGVQRGTIHDMAVTDEYGRIADIRRYRSIADMQTDWDAGRLDAIFITRVVGAAMFDKNGRKARALVPLLSVNQDMGIAVRKSDTALAAKMQAALEKMRDTPRYRQLIRQWLGSAEETASMSL